jgi:hypothetical protein
MASLVVVGHCLSCGAPIYGPEKIHDEGAGVVVRWTCLCSPIQATYTTPLEHKNIKDLMQTK